MKKFTLIHLITIIALILLLGLAVLWLFHQFIPNPLPNTETYLLLVIYLSMVFVTAYAFSTNKLSNIHKAIGFKYCKIRHIIISLVAAILIWVFDFILQVNIFNVNMLNNALKWQSQHSNIISVAITSVIVAPIIEEMLFRGIFLQTVNNYMNKFWSALLVSAAFALVHYSFIDTLSLFIAALVYAWLTYKSKSIIPAIIAHIINNCLTFIYYLLLINPLPQSL